MAAEFRCEKCGKLLSVEAEPSAKVKCPYCKARVQVPAGVAALPRPQVPPGTVQPPPAPQGEPQEQVLAGHGQDALMGVMSALMPWVISAFFHAGILLILAFITIVVFKTSAPPVIEVPETDFRSTLDGQINPGQSNPRLKARSLTKTDQRGWSQHDSTVPLSDARDSESEVGLYGISGPTPGGPAAPFGLSLGGSGRPKSRFMGLDQEAYHIVYVVDRSGSMLSTFDEVRREMLRSITRLHTSQTFHVIFFASGTPKENTPGRLVYANKAHKREAVQYLDTIQPQGQTDPMPALKRAFEVLRQTPNTRRGKLIYLLTDADFPDNEQVIQTVRRLNADKRVHINTILHHYQNESAMKVLTQIAEENGGRFKYVPAE